MAFPLIAYGLAAIAGFIYGCVPEDENDASGEAKAADPCEGIDCSGRGVCVPTNDRFVCICERGYYQEEGKCLPDETGAGGPDADSDVGAQDEADEIDNHAGVDDVVGTPDDAPDDVEDHFVSDDDASPYADPRCQHQACAGPASYICIRDGYSPWEIACPEGQECRKDVCRDPREPADPACPKPNQFSACEVIDEIDVLAEREETPCWNPVHHPETTAGYSTCCSTECFDAAFWKEYPCAGEGSYFLFGTHQANHGNEVIVHTELYPPTQPAYYTIELSMSWFNKWYSDVHPNPPTEECLASVLPSAWVYLHDPDHPYAQDNQYYDLPYSESWQQCGYTTLATFRPTPSWDSTIDMGILNTSYRCTDPDQQNVYLFSVLGVSKVRVTGCKCADIVDD